MSLRFREPGVLEQIAWQTPLVILAPLLWRRGLVEIVGETVPQATALRTSPDGESDR